MAATESHTPAIFCPLEPRVVDDILRDAPVVELGAGIELAPRDFDGTCMLVVEDGLAIIRADYLGTARGVVVCHAGPGALALPPADGEVLRTLTPLRATLFTTEIRDRVFTVPEAAVALFDALAATLRQKHQTIATIANLHHVDRVRDKLIQLARDHGRVGPDGVRLDFPLTHELLAQMTGSARETVTRALEELQDEGFVVRRGRSYRINVDPDRLRL